MLTQEDIPATQYINFSNITLTLFHLHSLLIILVNFWRFSTKIIDIAPFENWNSNVLLELEGVFNAFHLFFFESRWWAARSTWSEEKRLVTMWTSYYPLATGRQSMSVTVPVRWRSVLTCSTRNWQPRCGAGTKAASLTLLKSQRWAIEMKSISELIQMCAG